VSEPDATPAPWLVFRRNDESFALDALVVRLVLPTPRVSGFPTSFEQLLGIFAHLGRVYPLLEPKEVAAGSNRRSAPIAIITSTDVGDVAFVADTIVGFSPPSDALDRLEPAPMARRAREALRRALPRA
jgi:chemotaxis signal transduction protein